MNLSEFLQLDLEKKFGISKSDAQKRINEIRKELTNIAQEDERIGPLREEKRRISSIESLYKIQEIIKPLTEDDSLGRHFDKPCRNCGENEVYCGHIDSGGADYNDNYWHLCLNCLDNQYSEKWTMFGSENSDDFKKCPFCGHDYWKGFGYY